VPIVEAAYAWSPRCTIPRSSGRSSRTVPSATRGRVSAPPLPSLAPPRPDRLGRAADTVVPVPRGGIRADSAGPPADWRRL